MNEKGSASLLGLVMILTISLIGLSLISKRINQTTNTREFQKMLLCTKEINGIVRDFSTKIIKSNKTLKLLTVAEYTSITIPVYGIFASKSAKAAKKIIKGFQLAFLASYLKNISSLHSKNCYFSPNLYITPFQTKILDFHRNHFSEVKKRRKKWRYLSYTKDKRKFISNSIKFTKKIKVESSLTKMDWLF